MADSDSLQYLSFKACAASKMWVLTAVLFFLLYFVFALYQRKNEVRKVIHTMLSQAIQHSFGPCEDYCIRRYRYARAAIRCNNLVYGRSSEFFSVSIRLRISCVMTNYSSYVARTGQLLICSHHRVMAALIAERRDSCGAQIAAVGLGDLVA